MQIYLLIRMWARCAVTHKVKVCPLYFRWYRSYRSSLQIWSKILKRKKNSTSILINILRKCRYLAIKKYIEIIAMFTILLHFSVIDSLWIFSLLPSCNQNTSMNIINNTFIRCFYPKRLNAFRLYFIYFCQYVFPGNRTHNLCAANTML